MSARVIIALIIFIGIGVSPILYNMGNASKLPAPEKPKGFTECVQDTQVMRTSHMKLLNDWRDNILRDGGTRAGKTANGTEYIRSFQNGCMKCHTSKEKFCDTCHAYASVKPYCWDCHIHPEAPILKEAM